MERSEIERILVEQARLGIGTAQIAAAEAVVGDTTGAWTNMGNGFVDDDGNYWTHLPVTTPLEFPGMAGSELSGQMAGYKYSIRVLVARERAQQPMIGKTVRVQTYPGGEWTGTVEDELANGQILRVRVTDRGTTGHRRGQRVDVGTRACTVVDQ